MVSGNSYYLTLQNHEHYVQAFSVTCDSICEKIDKWKLISCQHCHAIGFPISVIFQHAGIILMNCHSFARFGTKQSEKARNNRNCIDQC